LNFGKVFLLLSNYISLLREIDNEIIWKQTNHQYYLYRCQWFNALVYMQKSFLSEVNYFFIDDDKERLASIAGSTSILVTDVINKEQCELLYNVDLNFIETGLVFPSLKLVVLPNLSLE